jgi:hypothetical protein
MPLIVSQVTDPSDLDVILPMEYDAWRTPYNPQLKHFRPDYLTRPESIAYTKARYVKKLEKNDLNEFIIKVTDAESKDIVGFAIWALNEMNTQDEDKTIASYYPEGSEEREFAELFIDGLWGFIGERITSRHMGTKQLASGPHTIPCSHLNRSSLHHRPPSSPTSRRRTHADPLGHRYGRRTWSRDGYQLIAICKRCIRKKWARLYRSDPTKSEAGPAVGGIGEGGKGKDMAEID